MYYDNENPDAILAMEKGRQRSLCSEYEGGDFYDRDIHECPVCGALYPSYFYMNDDEECVGCEMCVTRVSELY